MIERIIKARRRFVLNTSSESHVFKEEGEVYVMRFGNVMEFDNLLTHDNFILSNKEELNKFLSGVLTPNVKDLVEIPIAQQDNTKPVLLPNGKEIDEVKIGEKLVDLYANDKKPEDKDIVLVENLIAELSNDKKKHVITLVEKSDISNDGKEKIVALLKKRTTSKCPICGKRKKKEEPFCTMCIQLKENTTKIGVGIV